MRTKILFISFSDPEQRVLCKWNRPKTCLSKQKVEGKGKEEIKIVRSKCSYYYCTFI